MSSQVRPYAPADHAAVCQLINEVLAEFGFKPHLGGLERDLAELQERYGGARAGFWVATDNDKVVGTVAVRKKDASTCELKRLYVRTDFRGQGVGQLLYEHAEAFARAAGYTRIFLDSSRRFGKAHRLYERNGFVLLAEIDNEWEDNEYEKQLF